MYMLHAVIYSLFFRCICLMLHAVILFLNLSLFYIHMFVEIKALQGLCCIVTYYSTKNKISMSMSILMSNKESKK